MENEIKLGVDYYFNTEGLFVFTKEHLLKKGGCCGNGCLHCPFNFENVQEPTKSILLKKNKQMN